MDRRQSDRYRTTRREALQLGGLTISGRLADRGIEDGTTERSGSEGVTSSATHTRASQPWSMPRRDTENAAFTSVGPTLDELDEPAWTFEHHTGLHTPVTMDGTLYVSDASTWPASVIALDVETGDRKWLTRLEGDREAKAAPVTATSETVFVGANSDTGRYWPGSTGYVLALDAADGTERWHTSLDRSVLNPVYPTADAVITAGYDSPDADVRKEVIALDRADGSELWSVPADQWTNTSGIAVADDLVISPGNDDTRGVVAYRTRDGSEVWRFDQEGRDSARAWPAVGQGRVFLLQQLDDGRRVVALTLEDGALEWTYERSTLLGTPAVDDEHVYCVTRRGTVVALEPQTGSEGWTFDANLTVEKENRIAVPSAPSVLGEHVYVQTRISKRSDNGYETYNGFLHGIDRSTGEAVRTYEFEEGDTSWPIFADGQLVVANNHDLYAFGDPSARSDQGFDPRVHAFGFPNWVGEYGVTADGQQFELPLEPPTQSVVEEMITEWDIETSDVGREILAGIVTNWIRRQTVTSGHCLGMVFTAIEAFRGAFNIPGDRQASEVPRPTGKFEPVGRRIRELQARQVFRAETVSLMGALKDGSVSPKANLDRIIATIDEVGACPVGLYAESASGPLGSHQVVAYDYHTLTSSEQEVVDIAVYDPNATASEYDSRPFPTVEEGSYRPPRHRLRIDAETGRLDQVSISLDLGGTWKEYGHLDPDSLEDLNTLLEEGVEAAEYLSALFRVAVHSPVSLAVTTPSGERLTGMPAPKATEEWAQVTDSVWTQYDPSGEYEIEVIGKGSGEFHLSARATDAEGHTVIDVEAIGTIDSGETITTDGRLTGLTGATHSPGGEDDSDPIASVSPETMAGGGVVGIGLLYLAARLLSDSE